MTVCFVTSVSPGAGVPTCGRTTLVKVSEGQCGSCASVAGLWGVGRGARLFIPVHYSIKQGVEQADKAEAATPNVPCDYGIRAVFSLSLLIEM